MKFTALIDGVKLSAFRAKRDEFYESLAKAYEGRELLKDFLQSELKISLNRHTQDRSRAHAMRLMLRRLSASEDSDVSTVLGAAMPLEDKLMLAAVRDAQDKPAVLRALASAVRGQAEMSKIMKKAVLPPLLILPGVFGFCYVMASKSIPMIVKMAPPEVWTPFNQFVRTVAEIIGGQAGWIVLMAVLLVALVRYQLPRWTGVWRGKLERVNPSTAMLLLPVCPILMPLGIYRDAQAGLMLSSLAVFLQSGSTLMDALQSIQRAGTPWMKWHVRKIIAHLNQHPTDYITAFSKGILSPQLLSRLASTIRNVPRFDEVLIQVGTVGSKEIREQVQKQAAGVNTMVMLFGASLVLLMMMGQFSITGAMQEEMSPSKMQARKAAQAAAQAHSYGR